MFAKLCVIIVTVAATALAVLAARQQRLEAVRDLARTQLRIIEQEQALLRLRVEIVRLVDPQRILQIAESQGTLQRADTANDDEETRLVQGEPL